MKSYLRFLKLIGPHAGVFSLAIVCMLLSTLFSASPLGLIVPLIDKVISGTDIVFPANVDPPFWLENAVSYLNALAPLRLLNLLTVLVAALFLLKGVFMFFQTYLMNIVSQGVVREIKNEIYQKLLGLSMDFYAKNPTGELMSRITYDTNIIRDAIGKTMADSFYQPLQILVYSAMLVVFKVYFAIPWSIILIGLVIFPLILFPVIKIGKRLKMLSRSSQEKVGDINNMLYETISGMKLVKAFNMEGYELESFRQKNYGYYKLMIKAVKRTEIMRPLTEWMGVLCVSVIMWMAGHSIVTGELSAGVFTAFIAAVFSMMKPVKTLSGVYGTTQKALAAAERIFDILDQKVSITEKPGALKLARFDDAIEYRNVRFSYDGKEEVIKGVDLKIAKGELVALVGPSGGGKSTLVNLIPRFYDPTTGAVTIDNVDLRDLSVRSLRAKIGLVTQETLLFNDTVRVNIAYGHTDVDEKQLVRVAKAANAHMFIKDFPEGYDTVIGERGLRISGGQRQRIAIARAVYKNPPILIFDEATSQLDTESEKLVQEAINNLMKGRTVVVIAHRLSTIINADKIVVVDKGRLTAVGKHKELLAENALYRKLYEMQFSE